MAKCIQWETLIIISLCQKSKEKVEVSVQHSNLSYSVYLGTIISIFKLHLITTSFLLSTNNAHVIFLFLWMLFWAFFIQFFFCVCVLPFPPFASNCGVASASNDVIKPLHSFGHHLCPAVLPHSHPITRRDGEAACLSKQLQYQKHPIFYTLFQRWFKKVSSVLGLLMFCQFILSLYFCSHIEVHSSLNEAWTVLWILLFRYIHRIVQQDCYMLCSVAKTHFDLIQHIVVHGLILFHTVILFIFHLT